MASYFSSYLPCTGIGAPRPRSGTVASWRRLQGAATEKNTSKTFITKGGNELLIDDTEDKQKISVKTKKGMGFEMNEEKSTITMYDKDKKNSVEIDSKKGVVTICADKKLVLKVGGSEAGVIDGSSKKISLKSADIELKADKGLTAKGQTMKIDGTSVTVKGASSLQLTSSGSAQLKGTIVKIN